jgi:hypothetical protein
MTVVGFDRQRSQRPIDPASELGGRALEGEPTHAYLELPIRS